MAPAASAPPDAAVSADAAARRLRTPQRGRGSGACGGRGRAGVGPRRARRAGRGTAVAVVGGRGGTRCGSASRRRPDRTRSASPSSQTNFAPVLDLDQHFLRDTLQTGPTPGFTFFPHVGTRADRRARTTPVRRRTRRAARRIFVLPPDRRAADETACARKIVTSLATRAFRRPASAADVSALMKFYQTGRKDGDFDQGIEMALARILADRRKFIYRIEAEPAAARTGQPYRISDLDLASRLSFFLWSTIPDEELITAREPGAAQGSGRPRAAGAPHAEGSARGGARGQLRRPVAEPARAAERRPAADALSGLRRSAAAGHAPRSRAAVRQHRPRGPQRGRSARPPTTRSSTNGWPSTTASRTSTAASSAASRSAPTWIFAGACSARARSSSTTSKPERTSPVTRGKWIMANILGMSPPDPPPDVPPLPPRAADAAGNAKEPTMRQKMLDHRVRADCIQCHSMMDPIGFSLENFDGDRAVAHAPRTGTPVDRDDAGLRRHEDRRPGRVAHVAARLFRSVRRRWSAEKLLTYALGRGVEYQDMPLVRSIARDAARAGNTLLGARAGRRQEQAVSDEHEELPETRDRSTDRERDGNSASRKGATEMYHLEEDIFRAGRS